MRKGRKDERFKKREGSQMVPVLRVINARVQGGEDVTDEPVRGSMDQSFHSLAIFKA